MRAIPAGEEHLGEEPIRAVPEEMEEAMGGWVLVMVACRAAGGGSKLVMKVKADHRLLGPRDKSEKWYSGFIF
jgi:hypothetical protein